jgi:hypothetical protein
MSEYRQLHRSFWESPSVEAMDPVEKLLYNYLITSPLSNMEGLYKTSLRRIAFETGIDRDMVVQLCERLEKKGLAGFRDGWVCVTQATVHMPKSPQMLLHAESVYESVPKVIHKWAESIGYVYGIALDKTRLDNTRGTARNNYDETRERNLVDKYGQATYDKYVQRVKDWAASKGKRVKSIPATAGNWMSRDEDEGKIAPRPGWGATSRPPDPTCEEGHTVKSTHNEALCMDCGKEWRLTNGVWV